ncbi:GNAT family N-acetyltransferase [Nocardioides insulae]|uniref:GNAT family N-acetyltransferase n=1 Tax=Nocardioides insulae TaxID=394734 RepID=UPI00048AB54D|nr:GNAT family N-acetyltransferase [Nocardioides insulae]
MVRPRLAASAQDFAEAAALQADFNREYDSPTLEPDDLAAHLSRLSAGGDTRVWLVGTPALGHGLVRLRTQTTVDELEGYLAEFYVVPDRRGQGLGSILLQAIIDDLRSLGATYLDLNTSEDDDSARAIYEKFGFDCHEGRGSGPLAIYYELDL